MFFVLCAFLLVGAQASAASKKDAAPFQYVGAFSINPSQDEKVLADWYERFGIHTQEMDEGYFGMFDTAAGPFFFGIHRKSPTASAKSSGSVDIVLKVADYDAFLANAAKNKIVPDSVAPPDPLGRFAYFIDPDGNKISIWGK
jgi:predicted enzyme related to lactoylglutathione lyase